MYIETIINDFQNECKLELTLIQKFQIAQIISGYILASSMDSQLIKEAKEFIALSRQ